MILWVLVFMMPVKPVPQLSFAFYGECMGQRDNVLDLKADGTATFIGSKEVIPIADLKPHFRRRLLGYAERGISVVPEPAVGMATIIELAGPAIGELEVISVVTPALKYNACDSHWTLLWLGPR
jgi:hypothetical protein